LLLDHVPGDRSHSQTGRSVLHERAQQRRVPQAPRFLFWKQIHSDPQGDNWRFYSDAGQALAFVFLVDLVVTKQVLVWASVRLRTELPHAGQGNVPRAPDPRHLDRLCGRLERVDEPEKNIVVSNQVYTNVAIP